MRNVYGHTVIGVAFNPKFMVEPVQRPAFPHDLPNWYNFHPDTGEPLWEVGYGYVEGVSHIGQDKVTGKDLLEIAGYPVVHSQDENTSFIALTHIEAIGIARNPVVGQAYLPVPDLQELGLEISKMRDHVLPTGFWDEEKFGIHVFVTSSGRPIVRSTLR